MSPSRLRDAAARLRAQSARLPGSLDQVAAVLHAGVLVGPAGDRLAGELADRRRTLRWSADRLDALARRLDAQADAIEVAQRRARESVG